MTDLSGVVNEQQATIEALRRRVAELEGERDTANAYLNEVLDRGNRVLGERDALTAENADLKRQVEALREACKAADDAFDKLDPPKGTRCGTAWLKVLEALREAAKGETR